MIALIMATLSEAKPFIVELKLVEEQGHPFRVFSGNDLILIISGIGKTGAASATTFCCMQFTPELVINLGAAGATVNSLQLGDIFHISEIYEFDRPIFRTGQPHQTGTDTLEGIKPEKLCTLATQDRAIISAEDRLQVSKKAKLVDMEGASIAQSCTRMGVRCLLFKFVSDTPEHPEGEDIYANIKKYRMGFCHFIKNDILPLLCS